MMTEATYILDISRLLARAKFSGPTGIDRVELAYAEYLLREHPEQVNFCAFHRITGIGAIDRGLARHFIDMLARHWAGQRKSRALRGLVIRIKLQLLRRQTPCLNRPIYLLLSHHHLMDTRAIRRFLTRTNARFVPMIHDVIPITYPEYARPREYSRHVKRIETVRQLAHAIIVPSNAVKDDLRDQLLISDIPIWAVPHGVGPAVRSPAASRPARSAFVYLSTIEPRKNHLTILHVWRRLIDTMGSSTPDLIIIGKRGWENENIIDLLDRSDTLRPYLREHNSLDDAKVAELLQSSRALLFPTLVEGYGLPLVEALNLGVPVLCSDIPVLREVGGSIPDYIDPIDGAAWVRAVASYVNDGPEREAQLSRLKTWTPFSWDQSVKEAISHMRDTSLDVVRPS